MGAALLVVACAAVPAGVGADEALGPLPWRVGGTVGFTVDATPFPDSAGHHLEVYVRVPPGTIAALVYDSTATGNLRLTTRLRSGHGGRLAAVTQEFEIAREDSARGFGKVVVQRFPMRPGPQRLEVRLEDTRSRKRGIAYFGRKVTEAGEVKGDFTLEVAKRGIDLSGIEFVWDQGQGPVAGAFRRADRIVLPNPERLFGLYATDVQIAFVARGGEADRAWRWSARALDAGGAVVAQRESTQAAAAVLEGTAALDVSQAPAGGYDLELRVWQEGDANPVVRRSRFSIAWQPSTWFRNPRDVEDAVHLLLQQEDEEAFASMQAGEQERFLDEFWQIRDPSPGSAINEAREAFIARVQSANLNFSRSGLGPGMLTDMGRVFVRYGEPSEILRQVIPTGENSLSEVVRELELSEDRDVGNVRERTLGGDLRPFEVWIYEGDIPPPFDADPRTERVHRKRLVFLFVDDHGLGQYRLRFSTE